MAFDFNALDHTHYMRQALNEGALAGQAGERPIGAVIVYGGRIIGRGRAEHRQRQNRLAHAELNALLATATRLYNHPHADAVIYTTLEPCEMCLGAIVMSDAVNHIVFALADRWINPSPILDIPHARRHIHTYLGGVLADESLILFEQYCPDEIPLIRDGKRT